MARTLQPHRVMALPTEDAVSGTECVLVSHFKKREIILLQAVSFG